MLGQWHHMAAGAMLCEISRCVSVRSLDRTAELVFETAETPDVINHFDE